MLLFADIKGAMKRLFTNKVLQFHTWSAALRMIGYSGYYITKPKYMELQYRQSASSASFFTGATSVATMAVGTMAGGYFLRYAKPKPRAIALVVLAIEVISGTGILGAMFLNCPTPNFHQLEQIAASSQYGNR